MYLHVDTKKCTCDHAYACNYLRAIRKEDFMDTKSIGLDLGHSAVKVVAGDFRTSFPSAATPAMRLSAPGSASSAAADTVVIDDQEWFVGETALLHTMGRVPDGLRDDWIETPEHKALLKAGYERALRATAAKDTTLCLGLPSRLQGRQSERLREIASSVLLIEKKQISVLPQPMAAYFDSEVTDDGKQTEEHLEDGAKIIVIDIGYYTTDFGAANAGQWSERASQSMQGICLAAEDLRAALSEQGIELPIRDCSAALRSKSIKYDGKVNDLKPIVDRVMEGFVDAVTERAERLFGPDLRTADSVLLVGGGAALVDGAAVRKRIRAAKTCKDPRFAIARGLYKFGALQTVEA